MSNPLAATSEATSRPLGSEVKLERVGRGEGKGDERGGGYIKWVGKSEEWSFGISFATSLHYSCLCKIPFQVLKPLFLLHASMEGVWLEVEHLQQGPHMMQTADTVDKN